MPPDGQRRRILALAQFGDEIDGIAHARQILAGDAQRVYPGQTHAQKHRVEIRLQFGQRHIAPQRHTGPMTLMPPICSSQSTSAWAMPLAAL